MALLECKDLSKSYGSHRVLNDLNLSIEPGQIIGLLGPNGQGKSTLIKSITTLIQPDKGEILLNGTSIQPSSLADIAYMPEHSYLDEGMTIQETLDMMETFYPNFRKDKAMTMIQDLHLDPASRIKTLSKGMQEKLQLILVMAREAKLYLLDEPLGGVDPAARDYILDTILTNFPENASIVLSTHLISDIERILDRVLFLQNGCIILDDEADTLRTKEQSSIDSLFRKVFSCSSI